MLLHAFPVVLNTLVSDIHVLHVTSVPPHINFYVWTVFYLICSYSISVWQILLVVRVLWTLMLMQDDNLIQGLPNQSNMVFDFENPFCCHYRSRRLPNGSLNSLFGAFCREVRSERKYSGKAVDFGSFHCNLQSSWT